MGSEGSAASGGVKRPERVAAVGVQRRRAVAKARRRQGAHRAPQQENILAPTPKIKPSAAVNIGHSDFAKIFTFNRRRDMMKQRRNACAE